MAKCNLYAPYKWQNTIYTRRINGASMLDKWRINGAFLYLYKLRGGPIGARSIGFCAMLVERPRTRCSDASGIAIVDCM